MPRPTGGIPQVRVETSMDEPLRDELKAYGERQTPALNLGQVIAKFCAAGVGYQRDRHLDRDGILPNNSSEVKDVTSDGD